MKRIFKGDILRWIFTIVTMTDMANCQWIPVNPVHQQYLGVPLYTLVVPQQTPQPRPVSPLVIELRTRIQGLPIHPFFTTDKQLERYLEDAAYSIEDAARRLERTAVFRAVIRADELLTWVPSPFLLENFPFEHTGYTKEGNPIFFLPLGQWNFKEFFHRGGMPSQLFYYFMRFLEQVKKTAGSAVHPDEHLLGAPGQLAVHHHPLLIQKRSGLAERVDQAVILVDARDYSVLNFLCVSATWTLLRIVRAASTHYPYLIKKVVIVNAPLAFRALWKLSRAFSWSPNKLSRRPRTYYQIFSEWDSRARNALIHHFPLEAIPVELGGSFLGTTKHYEFVREYEEHILAKRNATHNKALGAYGTSNIDQIILPSTNSNNSTVQNVHIHLRSVPKVKGGNILLKKYKMQQVSQNMKFMPFPRTNKNGSVILQGSKNVTNSFRPHSYDGESSIISSFNSGPNLKISPTIRNLGKDYYNYVSTSKPVILSPPGKNVTSQPPEAKKRQNVFKNIQIITKVHITNSTRKAVGVEKLVSKSVETAKKNLRNFAEFNQTKGSVRRSV